MASSKSILSCQARQYFNKMSFMNNGKTRLTYHFRKQSFAVMHRQTLKRSCLSNRSLISNKPRYFSDNSFNETSPISDSYDRIDRHVSLGQGMHKSDLDESDNILSNDIHNDPKTFRPKNVLILTKLSRYQFEKQQHAKDMPEDEFRHFIEKRGSDYTLIKYYHNIHKSVEEQIVHALKKRGLEVKICQRTNYTDNLVDWSDLIVTAGGDGTFLLGASKIKDRNKPIIGINSDPTRSEGHLCLPKYRSLNVDDAVQALVDGKVKHQI